MKGRVKPNLKKHFKTLSEILHRIENRRCAFKDCKKRFSVVTWKTGIDRAFCREHRDLLHEEEARKLDIDEAINNMKDDNEIS